MIEDPWEGFLVALARRRTLCNHKREFTGHLNRPGAQLDGNKNIIGNAAFYVLCLNAHRAGGSFGNGQLGGLAGRICHHWGGGGRDKPPGGQKRLFPHRKSCHHTAAQKLLAGPPWRPPIEPVFIMGIDRKGTREGGGPAQQLAGFQRANSCAGSPSASGRGGPTADKKESWSESMVSTPPRDHRRLMGSDGVQKKVRKLDKTKIGLALGE